MVLWTKIIISARSLSAQLLRRQMEFMLTKSKGLYTLRFSVGVANMGMAKNPRMNFFIEGGIKVYVLQCAMLCNSFMQHR